MVGPGNSAPCLQTRPAPDKARPHSCMVRLPTRPSSRSAPLTSQIQNATVVKQLEEMIADIALLRDQGDVGAGRIWQLAQPLLTYIRLNKDAIVDYRARYRSGRRIATALAESAVNSVTARRMVKRQQMRWSKRGAHLMLQVRAAVMNGDLREQLSYQPPIFKSRLDWLFKPIPPLLRAA